MEVLDTFIACRICQKKCSSRGNLKAHIRRHEVVKPYVCSDIQSVSVQQMNQRTVC